MAIQWFPGHMNKTRQKLAEAIKTVNGVLEIADARAPLSSRNPLLDEILGNKPRLLLLNKSDLADPNMLKEWLAYFKSNNIACLPISSKNRQNLDRLKGDAEKLGKVKLQTRTASNKILIVGVPNCGKSTLINALARVHKAEVANRPGVTRDMALYRMSGLDLYDSPGTLWPNLEDQIVASKLAALGAVKDEIYIVSEALEQVWAFLYKYYKDPMNQKYNIELSDDYHASAVAVSNRLGKGDNLELGALTIFKDLRDGKFGLICLERPCDIVEKPIETGINLDDIDINNLDSL